MTKDLRNMIFITSYPYTVDFEEEDEINGILGLVTGSPRINRTSVELTRLLVIAPKNYQLRYKAENFYFVPEIKEQGDKNYTWEIKNLPAKMNIAQNPSLSGISLCYCPSILRPRVIKGIEHLGKLWQILL